MNKFIVNLMIVLFLLISYSYAMDPLDDDPQQTAAARARTATSVADDAILGMTEEVKEVINKLSRLADERNLQEGFMGRAASVPVNMNKTIKSERASVAFLLLDTMAETIGDLEDEEEKCVATIKAAIGSEGRQTLLANHPEFSSNVIELLKAR